MYWKVFTEANTPEKAKKVLKRVVDKMAVTHSNESVEPYHKGGFVCTFEITSNAQNWSEVVIESLSLAQRVGRGWVLYGNIENEIDAWSN
ncbi:MAG: hypothetical protein ABW107_17660, partial [Candidatus Thiodiazotropha sp. 6PLUC5]